MRVLALTSSFPQHPSDERSVFIKRLYDAMATCGVELIVAAPHPYNGELSYRLLNPPRSHAVFGDAGLLRTVKASPTKAFGLFAAARDLSQIIREVRPNVVHANWSFAGMVAALSGIPSVVSLRGSDVHLFKVAPVRWLTAAALGRATVVTAVGAELAASASRALHRSVFVVENGTELAAEELVAVPEKFFVAVGTVSEVKGTLALVGAFSKFAEQDELHTLVIAGRLSDARYVAAVKQRIAEHGLSDRVRLLGPVSPGQVTYLVNRASGFCGFSHSEGRPNAVLEAQLAGLPCLLSDIPAHREIARSVDTLFEFGSEESAAAGLVAIASSARTSPQRMFSWRLCAERYLQLYQGALRTK